MSISKSDAPGVKETGRKEIKGCVFGGTVDSSDRGYVDQLPDALCMSAGCETQMHRAERYSGQCRICSIGGRTDHCRRGCEGSLQALKDPTKWGVQVIEDYALKRDDYADFSPRGNVVL